MKKTILDFLKKNNHWAIASLIIVILVGGLVLNIQKNRINNLKYDYNVEVKLKNALIDSVYYYYNKKNQLVGEKLTLQTTIDNLNNMYDKLSNNQKELINSIKEINKNNIVIAAAIIETRIKVDSILHGKNEGDYTNIDTVKKVISFINPNGKYFQYSFKVNNVLPAYKNIIPSLIIDSLKFSNKQLIDFHWKDDKKEGYPISFSVTNDNPYFQTINIDSYAIPELDKQELRPTFGQKVGKFFKEGGGNIGYFGIGTAVGVGAILLLK
jgi:hypothetical protein